MLGIGIFWKSQKLIPTKKNQSVLIAKNSSRKTQKIANLQKNSGKFVPHDISFKYFLSLSCRIMPCPHYIG